MGAGFACSLLIMIMNKIFFKDLQAESIIYALIKDDELKYVEGQIISIGMQRPDLQKAPNSLYVIDVTYTLDNKTYTDAVDLNAYMFSTKNPGTITLVSTDQDTILQEVKATLKTSESYLEEAKTKVPRNQNRVKQCKDLIAKLDKEYAQQQAMESRVTRLEESVTETNGLLKELINKINENK